jgi:ribonuclease R
VIHRCFEAVYSKKITKNKRPITPIADTKLLSGTPGQRRGAGLMPEHLGQTPDYGTLVNLGKHISFTERRSADAERDLRAVKVLQLLAEHVGDVIDGVVTGVTNFGIFVQSTRFLTEGMIRVADLPDDYWQFDDHSGVLRGQRTGRRISLGDRAKVQIVNVNVSARQLDLRLLEHGSSIGGDTALRRMEPRRQPKPLAPGNAAAEEGERAFRKKNLAKRQERKERARQAARQERHGKHRDKGPGRRGRRR